MVLTPSRAVSAVENKVEGETHLVAPLVLGALAILIHAEMGSIVPLEDDESELPL